MNDNEPQSTSQAGVSGAHDSPQDELLERILHTIPVLLTIYDPELRDLQINNEFTRVLGWKQDELAPAQLIEAVYPEPDVRQDAMEFMESLAPGWRDFPMRAKNGLLVETSWANIRLSDRRVVGIGIDIGKRLEAERSLRASDLRLKLALDAMELGTVEHDPHSGLVHWSARTKAIYGLPPNASVDVNTMWQAIDAADAVKVRSSLRLAVKSGSGRFVVEHQITGIQDGVSRWIAIWGRAGLSDTGDVVIATGVVLDLTERRRAHEALAQARARQEILTDVVSRLLTSQNPHEILEELGQRLLAATKSDEFLAYFVDSGTNALRLNSFAGISPETAVAISWFPADPRLVHRGAEPDSTPLSHSAIDDCWSTATAQKQRGIETYSWHPLVSGGEMIGTLGFGRRTQNKFTEEDHDLMQAIADHMAIAIQRRRDRAALIESEERYRTVARNIPLGGVWVVDQDLRLLVVEGPLSAKFIALGGFRQGQVLSDEGANEDLTRVVTRMRLALRGEATSLESVYRGVAVWSHFGPIRNDQGEVTGALVLALDVSERRRAEDALRESERRERARAAELEAIMDAVPAATWVTRSADCGEVSANRFGAEILRVRRDGSVSHIAAPGDGPGKFRVSPGGDVAPELIPLKVAASEGTPVRDAELEVSFGDGSSRFLFGSAVPLLDAEGRPAGAVAAFIDITDRKRIDEQLRETAKRESVGVLAGGVAHDFNNLLTGILGHASLAQLDAPPAIAERLQKVIGAAEQAAGLTRQLLAYAGKGNFLVSDVDLARVIRSSAELVRVSVTRNVKIQMDAVPETLPAIRADAAQLQQLVMNLVINAAEAIGTARAGTVKLSAGVGGARSDAPAPPTPLSGDRYVYLAVDDTGSGIQKSELSKIFDPFYSTKFTGRGLGLAAVHGIVRSMGGNIAVESTPGIGSKFTLFLPCGDKAPSQDALKEATEQPADSATAGAMVLVVDDEPLVRDVARMALESYGFRATVVEDGRKAIQFMSEHDTVDAVLLDVVMPVMSGLEALGEIRRRWPSVPVVLTSGYERQEAERIGGFKDRLPFIQKPYTVHQLVAAVDGVLRTKRRKK